ncbi:MAG: pSer/pThr/pTyr-binding forkhead associated (FHA) protein, partial [Neolewinella sp.]
MVRTRIEVQNGNDELTFDSGLVTIGGRTGVNVVLRDVMVADRHCVITYEDGFVVRDSGSVTGTWVNGERAAPAANLEDGTTIVIGTSKLHVSIETDNGTLVLQLKSDPQSFWWKKPGKGAFDNDPDQLAYAETKFGRFPALRLGNRLAMIVGGVVL